MAQLVATLAETGCELSAPILVGGEELSVSDLLEDLTANYYPKRYDIEWTAVSLACYGKGRSWENRFGETYSMSGLVDELLKRRPTRQSCGGMHLAQALAWLSTRASDRLGAETKDAIGLHLNGLWEDADFSPAVDISWSDSVPRAIRGREPSLLLVGHAVELSLDFRGVVPRPANSNELLRWLREELVRRAQTGKIAIEDYCAVTHGFRAVMLGGGLHATTAQAKETK